MAEAWDVQRRVAVGVLPARAGGIRDRDRAAAQVRSPSSFALPRARQPNDEQRGQLDRVREGLAGVALHAPREVDHREDRRDVSETVQALPARVAETLEG